MKQQSFWLFFAALSALIGISVNQVYAQQQAVTIALPPFAEALLDNSVFDNFEAQYGVQVEIIYTNPPGANSAPQTVDDVEGYAEDLEDYMSSADVLLVGNFLNPEITRAGYVLDLNPLISADSAVNPADFYTAVWNSFMWDAGMWGMPIAGQPLLLDYNIEAFDAAGLAYPNQNWTLDDFEFAARELTQYDENGEVELPGMLVGATERNALFRALSGSGFYDNMNFPETPFINTPELASLLEQWNELIADGVIRVGGGGGFGGQNDDIAMQIGSGGTFAVFITDEESDESTDIAGGNFDEEAPERGIALLPNGQSVVLGTGLGISSGSTIPDVAYNLVRYLSEQQAFADLAVGSEPARRNYFTESIDSPVLVFSFGDDRTEEEQAMINDALDNGLASAELRFAHYINAAVTKMQEGTDAVSALQEAELDAVDTIQAMDDLEPNFTVISGIPVEVSEGEVIISFGFQSFIQPLPNQAEWDQAVADFVAQDSRVGAVDLEVINIAQGLLGGGGDTETYDCTYYPNTLFVDIDDELLLALDPLLFSDPNYNVGDLPFGALELAQLNGITYGLPITIQPQMLQYNPDMFAQAGLLEPNGGWSISEFGDALAALDNVVDEETAPFTATGFDNTYLLMLVAAQGGLPIDTSTTPPTIDFTSPESLSAVQLVLDWVDAGYIDQGDAGGPGGGGGGGFGFGGSSSPITPTFFAGIFSDPNLNFVTYPQGTGYTPVSFDIGAGYISVDSDVPEDCFRWLSFISRQPQLFTGAMPAQLSLLDNPDVQASLSEDAIESYRNIANQMAAPNVVNFNATDPFMTTWLTRAMESYLANDTDLQTELEDAQQYTLDYLACSGNIEFEISIRLFQSLQECVEAVDSAIID